MRPERARVRIEEGVEIGSGGGRALRCDLFHPPEPPATAAGYQAVLLVHGGAWYMGDRTQLRGYGILLARAGYLCAAVEYRLSGEAKWPAQLHDVNAGMRYLRAHAERLQVDPSKIIVWGNSAGGHLALMLAATAGDPEFAGEGGNPGVSSECAACIAFYPPTRLYSDSKPDALAVGLFAPGTSLAQIKRASPIEYARRNFPPTLLIHGNRDDVVAPEASLSLYTALASQGAPVELHMYNGALHGFDAEREYGRHCLEVAMLFLRRSLG